MDCRVRSTVDHRTGSLNVRMDAVDKKVRKEWQVFRSESRFLCLWPVSIMKKLILPG